MDRAPVTLLVAPAGSGKTTTLAHWASEAAVPVGWCAPGVQASSEGALLDVLADLLRRLGVAVPPGWRDLDHAVAQLHEVDRDRVVLVVDDAHDLVGSAAESCLFELAARLPDWLRVVVMSRRMPSVDVTRLRLDGTVEELPARLLEWRAWEVERLFRDHYDMWMRPEDVALLTRRTEGWAAGLQLFHLASRELPAADRRQLIDRLNTRLGLVREYLTANVMAGLEPELRAFLLDTCVLGTVTPALCDDLRGRSDSAHHLRALEQRAFFLVQRPDGLGYRYHEVLRSHLEASLLDVDDESDLLERYQRAGKLLEQHGQDAEALRAYCRAAAWDEVSRILETRGDAVSTNHGHVLDRLPPTLVETDPWLRSAAAWAVIGDGHLHEGLAALRSLVERHPDHPVADRCRAVIASLHPWIDESDRPATSHVGVLRSAVRRAPRQRALELEATGEADALHHAVTAHLLAGDLGRARLLLGRVARDASSSDASWAVVRRVQRLLIEWFESGGLDATEALRAAESVEQFGFPFIAEMVRTVAAGGTAAGREEGRELARQHSGTWGDLLVSLAVGVSSWLAGEGNTSDLDRAADCAVALGAGTLEAWARSVAALVTAEAGDGDAETAARAAQDLAHRRAVRGAEALAEVALGRATGDPVTTAGGAARLTGLGMRVPATSTPSAVPASSSPLGIRCFGGLSVRLASGKVDVDALRPQARTVLAVLALSAGSPVHRDRLARLIWPDAPIATARQRLGVAVSTIRRSLEPDAEARRWTLLRRNGESYVLLLPSDHVVDVIQLDAALTKAADARRVGDAETQIEQLRRVLAIGRAELLPEFGDAEWLDEHRQRLSQAVAHSAEGLATLLTASGDHRGVIEAARAGLSVDRYRVRLWDLVRLSHLKLGDEAAALRVEEQRDELLAELGLA